MMHVESARNAVSRSTTGRLERRHPGFRVVAGPYVTGTAGQGGVELAERAACARVLRDMRRAGCEAKIVVVGTTAFVLRSAQGWRCQQDVLLDDIRGSVKTGTGGLD